MFASRMLPILAAILPGCGDSPTPLTCDDPVVTAQVVSEAAPRLRWIVGIGARNKLKAPVPPVPIVPAASPPRNYLGSMDVYYKDDSPMFRLYSTGEHIGREEYDQRNYAAYLQWVKADNARKARDYQADLEAYTASQASTDAANAYIDQVFKTITLQNIETRTSPASAETISCEARVHASNPLPTGNLQAEINSLNAILANVAVTYEAQVDPVTKKPIARLTRQ